MDARWLESQHVVKTGHMTRIKFPTASGLAGPEEKEWNNGEHPVAAQAPLDD